MSPASRPARRPRAEIVRANDEALRNAVAEMTVEDGWDAVTFTGVARRAGLTVGAVYGRAESRSELGIDLWENRSGPWFDQHLTAVLDQGRADSPRGVARELRRWDEQREQSALVAELLIAALFDDDLDEVVGTHVRRMMAALCTPSTRRPRVTAHEAAAATLMCSFTLGRAVAARAGSSLPPINTKQAAALSGLFAAPPARRSAVKPTALDWVRPMTQLDPQTRAIMTGTLEVIGRVGYRRATIARIARAAGIPRGSVLTRYRDKAHLVGEAVTQGLVPPGEVWAQYAPVVAEHGPLLSRALFLADFLQPRNAPMWALNLELTRMARVVPELHVFLPGDDVLVQTHLGVMLVASFAPDLHLLPFAGPFNAGTAT